MDRNSKARLSRADKELSDHFTAAIGVKGQRYEPAISGGDSSREEGIMAPASTRAMAQHGRVESLLAGVSSATLVILRLVYAHGTDALWTDVDGSALSDRPTGLVTQRNGTADPFGLLRFALAPGWGHGSYLRLCVTRERAMRAFVKRYSTMQLSATAVLDFLAYEAGRGAASSGMLSELQRECEEARDRALTEYDAARVNAHRRATKARDDADAVVER